MGVSAEVTSLVERGDAPELSHSSAVQAAVTSVSSSLSVYVPVNRQSFGEPLVSEGVVCT